MTEQLLSIVPMITVGAICSYLNYKFHISKRIWALLKIRNLYIQIAFFILIVVVLSILSIIIWFVMSVPESMYKPVGGIVTGIAFLLLPFDIRHN